MSRPLFGGGSNYPPGCSGPPEDDTTCPGCGRDCELEADKGGCACAPCPTCGEPGCVTHLPQHDLERELERLRMVAHNYDQELRRRYNLKPVICAGCKKLMTFEEVWSEECNWHGKCRENEDERLYIKGQQP